MNSKPLYYRTQCQSLAAKPNLPNINLLQQLSPSCCCGLLDQGEWANEFKTPCQHFDGTRAQRNTKHFLEKAGRLCIPTVAAVSSSS